MDVLRRLSVFRISTHFRCFNNRVVQNSWRRWCLQYQDRISGHLIHTTGSRHDLMEFFDEEENWKKDEVPVGRPWKMDELRIKSNTDLHKLWYVLLKERNMLLTMEHVCYDEDIPMASPERIEKVEESMENVLDVIKERDTVFNLLETGETGQPEVRQVINTLGLLEERLCEEHYVPKDYNDQYKLLYPERVENWQKPYIALYREEMERRDRIVEQKVKKRRKDLLEKFPDLTDEDLEHGLQEYRTECQNYRKN